MNQVKNKTNKFLKFELKVSDEITLKLMDTHDVKDMFEVTSKNREFLAKWLSWANKVKSPQNSLEKITNDHIQFANNTGLELGIFKKGKFIGRVGFHTIKGDNAEVGYWLDKSKNGQGIITESLKVLIKYSFTETSLHRIIIKMDTENIPSKKVPERLGFTCEGIERGSMLVRGEYRDSFVYSLLKTDPINF